jgi:hypothetical protein
MSAFVDLLDSPLGATASRNLLRGTESEGGLVHHLVVTVMVGCVATAIWSIAGRGRAPARDTGVAVEPALSVRPERPWRLVGGAVLPGFLGKTSATWPFGVMEGNDSWVEVRIRPGWLAGIVGARPMRVSPAEDVEVFPARGWFGMAYLGIRTGDHECYFECPEREELLGRLQACGFQVRTTERKIVWL